MGSRKEEILAVASKLFLTKDYEQTTMSEIMGILNIAKGTIYHYFRSKEALFEAVIESIAEDNIKKMESLLKNSSANAMQNLKLLIEAGNIAQENEKIVEELHNPGNNAMHTRLLAAIITKQAPLYAKVIKQGCKEGIFKTQAPLECAELILSGIQFLTDIGVYPWTDATLARRQKAFPKLIEQILGAPKDSFNFLTQHIHS